MTFLEAGSFEKRREEEAALREIQRLAARARQPAQKPALVPAGTVVLPAFVGEQLADGRSWLSHVCLAVVLEFQFVQGRAWARHSHFERAPDGVLELVVDAVLGGPFGRSLGEDALLPNWQLVLDELCGGGWYTQTRRGRELRIRRGPALDVEGRRAA